MIWRLTEELQGGEISWAMQGWTRGRAKGRLMDIVKEDVKVVGVREEAAEDKSR